MGCYVFSMSLTPLLGEAAEALGKYIARLEGATSSTASDGRDAFDVGKSAQERVRHVRVLRGLRAALRKHDQKT